MKIEELKEKVVASKPFEELGRLTAKLESGQELFIRGAAGSLIAVVASGVFEETAKPVLFVASDDERAEKLRDDCSLLLGDAKVRYFGARPVHHAQSLDLTASIAQVEALKTLSSGSSILTVTSPKAIVERVPSPEQFVSTILELHSGREYPFSQLISRIEHLRFERKNFVESYGDVAIRGGIVDVFPFVGENPIRIEFWGDRIESIREFDVLSQRSIRELQVASIVPSLMAGDGEDAGTSPPGFVIDYLQQHAIIILDEPELIEQEIAELFKEGGEELMSYRELSDRIAKFARIKHTLFTRRSGSQIAVDFGSVPQPAINGSIKLLVEQLERFAGEGFMVYLTSDTQGEMKRLKELIDETGDNSNMNILDDVVGPERDAHFTSHARPEFMAETLHSGFVFPLAKIAVVTEHEIFNRLKRRGAAKRRRFKGFSQKELQQLSHGDYVVHIDHGIGTFEGLKKITIGGVEQEVMKVNFAGEDALYVNLNFINRVQKYSSQEGHVPKLSRLGGGEWEKAKARAKWRIKDIARDIIALYAKRKLEKGFAFSPDTHWQKELEASFMYEDTVDQAKATLDVKNDMESSSPMDRLICGDVGFGKTEVAVRAAFKSVMDGKQVALLVPTTILALQHHNTFLDRLARYATRVENITRFKSKIEQEKIVEGLHGGSVDIIIGTHRLLSKDIAFKDLGLLIIDEEHRFGVAAKEKLRRLKTSVDTLALTATPIPRTLHFSLIGARDLSLIATAPRNRIPILTEIIPADAQGRKLHWQVIREAILKELHRGGQVYFVHDRVSTIDSIAELVKEHAPEAKVHIAHGQMSGHELEKTMLDFLEKKYDVLVCTKIIESGLDIPSVNTIIINRADMFGLAELYQLRGRVGRSNVQAYAYLLTPPLTSMPKTTLRRLQAIEEFTELGSGFNLAMRDLEIRGAGNLLGGEQSGFIMEMGFEMYERIVREAVEELRSEEFSQVFDSAHRSAGVLTDTSHIAHHASVESLIDADIDALIPDFYIESDAERLDVYRRLYKAAEEEEIQAIRAEFTDRFGEYPEEVEHLLRLIELRLAASHAGFPQISIQKNHLAITLPPESDEVFYGKPGEEMAPFQKLMKKIGEGKLKDVRLKQIGNSLTLQKEEFGKGGVKERLMEAKRIVEELHGIWGTPDASRSADYFR